MSMMLLGTLKESLDFVITIRVFAKTTFLLVLDQHFFYHVSFYNSIICDLPIVYVTYLNELNRISLSYP